MDGLLVVDKPAGPTSHDVVARVRRAAGERRIGHTGTLDPLASGVLPLVVGRATRLARFLSASDKTYEAVVELGLETDTYDAQGRPVGRRHAGPFPEHDEVGRALDAFRGTFMQAPPMFSAKKIAGVRSYTRARQQRRLRPGPTEPASPSKGVPEDGDGGMTAAPADEKPAVAPVTVSELSVLRIEGPHVTLRITCSAGFYVRSLAHDLGCVLGTGAHLAALRRTRSGELSLADAVPLDAIERDPGVIARALVPLRRMLPAMAAVRLTAEGARRARHGRDLGTADFVEPPAGVPPPIRLLDGSGDLVGVAEAGRAPGLLHPAVVLV